MICFLLDIICMLKNIQLGFFRRSRLLLIELPLIRTRCKQKSNQSGCENLSRSSWCSLAVMDGLMNDGNRKEGIVTRGLSTVCYEKPPLC